VQTFRLIPHLADGLPEIEVVGEVDRVENGLSVRYKVQGNVEAILLPAPSAPTRKDDLWNMTCFEFFLAVPDQPEYWEFNLSPSGEWNVYHMDAYRQVNMREEAKFCQLPFEFRKDKGYSFELLVDLSAIIQAKESIQIGVAAITQTKDGSTTYWALAHPGTPTAQADFHLRDSFILEV